MNRHTKYRLSQGNRSLANDEYITVKMTKNQVQRSVAKLKDYFQKELRNKPANQKNESPKKHTQIKGQTLCATPL